MKKPVPLSPETLQVIDETSDVLPSAQELGLLEDGCVMRQKGGRGEGLKLLPGFLHERSESYTKKCHRPLQHLTAVPVYQLILPLEHSMREVFQSSEERINEIKNMPCGTKGKWPGALRSFSGRLRWHCHFIQKLEDEPRIEFENMHPAYDGLRESDFNEAYYAAWQAGKTGYPMVDACMCMLTATGWLNFRMRAMLMSFASYHLWLHWRKPALHLARLFTDYERASITAKLKCNRVPQASTAFVFIIRSSKVWTTILMAHLSVSGFPSWQICSRNSSIRHGKHPLK